MAGHPDPDILHLSMAAKCCFAGEDNQVQFLLQDLHGWPTRTVAVLLDALPLS